MTTEKEVQQTEFNQQEFNLAIGLRIRTLRESLHESRESFSEKCDISASFLSDIERGKKCPTAKTIYKICQACAVSSDYLILGRVSDFRRDTALELLSGFNEEELEHVITILHEIQALRQQSKNSILPPLRFFPAEYAV